LVKLRAYWYDDVNILSKIIKVDKKFFFTQKKSGRLDKNCELDNNILSKSLVGDQIL